MKRSDNNDSPKSSQIREVIEQLQDHRLSYGGEARLTFPAANDTRIAPPADPGRFGFPVEFGS